VTAVPDRDVKPLVLLSAACEVLAGHDEHRALEKTWARYRELEARATDSAVRALHHLDEGGRS
jgi:hypothetical protein